MSFNKMKRDDLYRLAVENFAVDVEETATKPLIIAALAEQGVTWDMAKTYDPSARAIADEEEAAAAANVITAASVNPPAAVTQDVAVVVVEKPVVVEPIRDERVLVRMERENPRYEIRGYRFTSDNPFALVNEKDLDFVLQHDYGFKMATPSEAREFYG